MDSTPGEGGKLFGAGALVEGELVAGFADLDRGISIRR